MEYVDQDLSGALFRRVDLSGARFRDVSLVGAQVRGALLTDVELDGDFERLVVNGVDVTAYVEAELDRRYPDRPLMRATDADGYRAAWAALERLCPLTLDRARALPAELLHERVDDEWSFTETLRHLLFVVDAWVKRTLYADPAPYHPLDLHHSELARTEGVPEDPAARPTLDEVVPLLQERMLLVRDHLARLTDEDLAGTTGELPAPGYPPAGVYEVRRCLRAVVNEFWEHRLIAERDLAVLEAALQQQAAHESRPAGVPTRHDEP